MPPKPDLSFARLDDSIYKSKISETVTSLAKDEKDAPKTSTTCVEKPKEDRFSAPLIEDWETGSDDDCVYTPEPIFAKIDFMKAIESVKHIDITVPHPLTGNYMPPKPDLSFARLDDSIYKSKISETVTSLAKDEKDAPKTSTTCVEKPKEDRFSAPLIEDWETGSDDDCVYTPEPIFAKIDFMKAIESVKHRKQHKATCKAKLVSSISQPLQMLHMDLFGPTSIMSINHKKYSLVVTDDFSRFSWVFFLAIKDETSNVLKPFITAIENQINKKVKVIRCDNGTEFKNRDLDEFCGMKGIKREYSNARTPQQNEAAERKIKTLIKA
nr:ribonuclease H-like domain-containing protein [Tanacetum cinerariifolium]